MTTTVTPDSETRATDTTAASVGRTYLALVANFTDKTLTFENLETGNDETAKPKTLSRLYDMFFPWCENEEDYKKRKIAITAGDKSIFWVWEKQNKLYYNRDNKFSSGKVIDGDHDNDNLYKAIAVSQAANGDFEMFIVSVKHT